MELRRFPTAAGLYERGTGFLVAHEAHHNLLLGICANLMQHPEQIIEPPYLATVEVGAEIVAVAIRTPPHNLVLSLVSSPDALRLIAENAYRQYGTLPGVLGPAAESQAFAEEWQRISGQSLARGPAERIYQLETV